MTKKAGVTLIVVTFLLLLIFVATKFFNPLLLFGSLYHKITGPSGYTITANFGESKVELSVPNKETDFLLTPVDKSKWPKDAIGGLYHLEPSGDFTEPIVMKMTFAKDPGPFFTLGYWHADTKKWEWVPTIKTAEGVYEAVLFHASDIGGAQNPNYTPYFMNPQNQAMADAINAELVKLQNEQADGVDRGGSWQKVWEGANELAKKLAQDFCDALSGKSLIDFNRELMKDKSVIHDLLAGMEYVGHLQFDSMMPGLQKAILSWKAPETDLFGKMEGCKEEEKINERAVYFINQTDVYDSQVNLNLGNGLYTANQTGETSIISAGAPTVVLPSSEIGWRTTWKVYQTSLSKYSGDQKIFKEGNTEYGYALMDIAGRDIKTNTKDRMTLSFDLTGVKEGDSFPVKQFRSEDYTSRASSGSSPIQGVIIIEQKGSFFFKLEKTKNLNKTETIEAGTARELTGVLLKDYGENGAVIGFKKASLFTPEQLSQFKAVMANAPAGLQGLYDAEGNPTFVSGDFQLKSLMITRKEPDQKTEEKINPEDEYKSADEAQKQMLDQNKPNIDANGDGVPDLAPLTQ